MEWGRGFPGVAEIPPRKGEPMGAPSNQGRQRRLFHQAPAPFGEIHKSYDAILSGEFLGDCSSSCWCAESEGSLVGGVFSSVEFCVGRVRELETVVGVSQFVAGCQRKKKVVTHWVCPRLALAGRLLCWFEGTLP